jgi:hypothetical protein
LTHALRVTEESEAFRVLFAAVQEQGERAGWLDLESASLPELGARDGEAGASGVAALERRLDDGAWKVVAVGGRRTLAVKSRRGPPVLRDLLREHFRGCRLVLVRGAVPLPLLRSRGADWELEGFDGAIRRLTTAQLVRALRSPRLIAGPALQ